MESMRKLNFVLSGLLLETNKHRTNTNSNKQKQVIYLIETLLAQKIQHYNSHKLF